MFERLPERTTAVDQCEQTLTTAIVRGDLAAGSRLPAERVLATELGVHRVTLRAALSRLASKGLISARQGAGNFVSDWRSHGELSLVAALPRGDERAAALADLLVLRRQLARAVLERLSDIGRGRMPGTLDHSHIAEVIDAFATRVEDDADVDVLAAADLEIIRALLAQTGSLVMQMCWTPLLEALERLEDLRTAVYRRSDDNLRGWRAVQAWLKNPTSSAIDTIVQAMEIRDDATLVALKEESA